MTMLGIIFTGCSGQNTDPIDNSIFDTRNAAAPVITLQPASVAYGAGDTVEPLTVEAAISDGGIISYQWYSNTSFSGNGGAPLEGQTGTSYAVTTAGYYYVIVTNTNENAERNKTAATTSSPAWIQISDQPITPAASLSIDTSTKYQYVRGFGGMSNVWTSPDMQLQDIDTMFSPNGLGLNMFRICIYPDNDLIVQNQGEQAEGIDNSDYYDFVKRVNAYGGYVLASPWTMPQEWKSNNSRTGGGYLLPENYGRYADYLKAYCQTMYDNGAPIYVVSIQNEPNWAATYDGCEWSPVQMRDFFKQAGHFTDGVKGFGGGQEIPTVLTMNGETANNPNINDAALDDADAAKNIDLIGRHIYGNAQVRYNKAIDMGKEVWQTEHNINSGNEASYPNDSTWNYVWKFLNEVDLSMRLNDENAFIWWYSKRFYSFIGDGQFGTIEHDVLPRGYAMSHFAKFAKETTRVGVTATGIGNFNGATFNQDSTDVKATAYESPDGNSVSLVIFTPTTATGSGGVNVGDLQINLPADFTARSAYAVISTESRKVAATPVVLSKDRKSAIVNVPASAIVSVKFTK
jgi:O-glycosyl hydrolase